MVGLSFGGFLGSFPDYRRELGREECRNQLRLDVYSLRCSRSLRTNNRFIDLRRNRYLLNSLRDRHRYGNHGYPIAIALYEKIP